MKKMSFLVRYINESLATTGLCIFDPQLAGVLRPDLWPSQVEAMFDFSSRYGQAVATSYVQAGSKTCQAQAQVDGVGRVKVFCRSLDQLAQRIEWLTGFKVASIDTTGTPEPLAPPIQTEALQRHNPGDVHAEVTTKETGRSCGTCENLSSASSCIRRQQSGIEYPGANVLRRCPAYQPLHTEADGRNGLVLWPELNTFSIKEANHGA